MRLIPLCKVSKNNTLCNRKTLYEKQSVEFETSILTRASHEHPKKLLADPQVSIEKQPCKLIFNWWEKMEVLSESRDQKPRPYVRERDEIQGTAFGSANPQIKGDKPQMLLVSCPLTNLFNSFE
jgi:hypothetical protein